MIGQHDALTGLMSSVAGTFAVALTAAVMLASLALDCRWRGLIDGHPTQYRLIGGCHVQGPDGAWKPLTPPETRK